MTYLETYADLIKNGEVIVGRYMRKSIFKLVREMNDERFVYDTTIAHKRIAFMEKYCRQSKAPYFNKPLVLMPWQKAFIECIYSFKMAETGLRRFTRVLLLIARKNGKSTLLAGDGFADLIIGVGGLELCCVSNADNQSRLIWEEIAGMRERLDPKKRFTAQNLTRIRNIKKNILITRMSSMTRNKDGRILGKAYMDEAHDVNEENGNSEIYEAAWRSMDSQDEPLLICCTSQGFSREGCWLDKQVEHGHAIIDGEIDDITFLPWLYEQDSEEEIFQDPDSWEKSNPSLRYGVKKKAKLASDVENARYDKASRIHLLCKDFNIRQSSGVAWLRAEDYKYAQPIWDLSQWRNAVCLGALDCSQTTDLTNMKLLFMRKGDPTKYVYSHYWIQKDKLTNSPDTTAGADYNEWIRQGHVTACDTPIIDLREPVNLLRQINEQYGIRCFHLGYDKAYATVFEEAADNLNPDMRIAINQKLLSTPMKYVEKDFGRHVINYNGNPVDEWCLANACCKIDNNENYHCVKSTSAKRIDGAVTLIMLYATLMRYSTEFTTIIEGGE